MVKVCPVCGRKEEAAFCMECGFGFSTNYEQYPTLMPIPPAVKSVQKLRAEYKAKKSGGKCKCCGQVYAGENCPRCGFAAIFDEDPANQAHIEALASKHRTEVLEEITDISIMCYQYKWDPDTGRFDNIAAKEERLCTGLECYDQIYWSALRFAQLPADTNEVLNLRLSYRYQGVKRSYYCNVPVGRSDGFWRLGVRIDAAMSLQLFLGSPEQYTQSNPFSMQLS